MKCLRFGSEEYGKDGFVQSHRRYECKNSSYRHTLTCKSDVKSQDTHRMAFVQWMMNRKVQNVFHSLCIREKNFTEIYDEYHFASVSHMGNFLQKTIRQNAPSNTKYDTDEVRSEWIYVNNNNFYNN